jgi:hypothetical protein
MIMRVPECAKADRRLTPDAPPLLLLHPSRFMVGQAEALTFYLRHQPPPAAPPPQGTLSTDLISITTEALALADKEEPGLAARLASVRGLPPVQAVTKLRVACMNLLCAVLSLDEFRAAMGEPPKAVPAAGAIFFL